MTLGIGRCGVCHTGRGAGDELAEQAPHPSIADEPRLGTEELWLYTITPPSRSTHRDGAVASRRRVRGEGGIRKRPDGRWEGSYVAGHRVDGRPIRRFVYAKSRSEAARKLAAARATNLEESDGTPGEPRPMEPTGQTLREVTARWLRSRSNLLPATVYKYTRELGPLLKLLGDVPASELRPHEVRDAYATVSEMGASVRTQKRGAMWLRAALRQAVQDEIIARSPAQGISVPSRRVEPVAQAWSADEVEAFLAVARQDRLGALFYLLLSMGLRSGEALGLPWRNVDLERGWLTVAQAIRRPESGDAFEIAEVKTPHGRRTLRMPEDVVAVLQAHRGGLDAGAELVFKTRSGRWVHPGNVRRSLRRLAGRAGVRAIRVHDLRHTHASLALRAGVPIEVVSRRLGHASVAITLDLYRHVYEEELEAYDWTLGDLLRPGRRRGRP